MVSRTLTELLEELRLRFAVDVDVLDGSLATVYRLRQTHPEALSFLIREMVAMDAAGVHAIEHERDRSRRLLTTLRFLRHLVDTTDAADLACALLQAIAVWFDVDARVYARDLTGGYGLFASLPGAVVDESSQRLDPRWLSGGLAARRIDDRSAWGHGAADMLLIPIGIETRPEWVLALIGAPPEEAMTHLPLLGHIIGGQLELSRARRRDVLRRRFAEIVRRDLEPELIVRRAVDELSAVSMAGAASLSLTCGRRVRRVAAVGSVPPQPAPLTDRSADWVFTPERIVCAFSVGRKTAVTLDMRPVTGKIFSVEAAMAVRVGIEVLQNWFSGACRFFDEPARQSTEVGAAAFLRRVDEEVTRANRLDARLSVVVLDVPRHAESVGGFERLHDMLRHELRGSDLVGEMDRHRVAALLTHTDENDLQCIVGRLRRRLCDSLGVNVNAIIVGHAAFSRGCRTAEAILSQAVRHVEAVAVR